MPSGLKPTERITYYARHFSVVEVNASYYHIMPARNYAGWVAKTPDSRSSTRASSSHVSHRTVVA